MLDAEMAELRGPAAPSGIESDGTRHDTSPVIPNACLLVANTLRFEDARRSSDTSWQQESSRCSQLSSTSSTCLLDRKSKSVDSEDWDASSCRPSADATAGATKVPSLTGDRSTKAVPSANVPARSA